MRDKARIARPLLLGFAFVAPLISLALIQTSIILALVPLFVSHLLLLYATLVANSQWWGAVLTTFDTRRDEVWLTIDDGPSPAHTIKVLDMLERFGARATFFVIGARAEKHPHLITEILARGHTLANHTFSHTARTFWCAGPQRIAREIDRCAETLRSSPARPNLFFRAPVGMTSPFLHPALARRGMRLVGWTVRGLDTIQRDVEKVAERIEKRVKPGAIILLHEGHQITRDPGFGPHCLELTLQRLSQRGYHFVIPLPEQLGTGRGGK
ncbi:MAG: polysaccharide deacetylase family protein [Chthoniobacterales bacterium]|nr:polysaccharide deacetylase family protein [Chthoniobacterales bacterium]